MRTVGAYDAKTHLPQLLDEVAKGESVTITKHGVPVAILVPPRTSRRGDTAAAIRELHRFRRGVTLGDHSLRDLMNQGRL